MSIDLSIHAQRKAALGALLLCLCSTLAARPFQPLDVFALEWADQPAYSPDGAEIAFTRQGLDIQTDQRTSQIWRLRVADNSLRPWVTGNASQPTYAPDGKSLAYLQNGQLMLRWLDTGDTSALATLPSGAEVFRYSPDSRQIAFAMFVERPAPSGAVLPTAPKGANWGPPVRVIDRLIHREDGAGELAVGARQLFVVPVIGGTPRQITQIAGTTAGTSNFQSFAWRADSQAIFASANTRADADISPDNTELHEVLISSVATAEQAEPTIKTLSDRAGPDDVADTSADGRYLLYTGFDERQQFHQNTRLYLWDLRTNKSQRLAQDLDRDVVAARFAEDSASVYFQYDDHGETVIAKQGLKGGAVQELLRGMGDADIGRPYGSGQFALSRQGDLAFPKGSAQSPAELTTRAANGAIKVRTALNADALAGISFSRVEAISTRSSFDQKPVQGWIMYPPGFDANKKYPLLLEIHGGPVANYGPRFSPELQLYAAAGYVVLYTNPRGSDSYGEAFANSIHHDYPNHDYDDLMSSVDAVVAKGFIDSKRLFVTGGSGGGVLTAWIVGHTDRFRAAVVAKPVINWLSFALTSDGLASYHHNWFPGFPWEHAENYLKRSPLMYVGNVKTPTMVLVGEADLRTPVAEAEQFYHALKLRKVPTQLVLIPGASHSISAKASHMLAQVLNTLAWFEQHEKP
jgi:dipeptidyl aminopeptidase/acylaminoacyl peptidase